MGFVKKVKLHLSSVILGCLVVGLVVFIAEKTPNELHKGARRRTPASVSRSPASIQKVFDFSYLQGDALEAAAKKRLLSSITVSSEESGAAIEVGNFVMLNDANQKDFACGYFDQVQLTFNAEGVAVSGERPTLTIHSGCQVGDNINYFNPIHIPVARLVAQEPGNTEYKFYDSDNTPMSIEFSDPPPQWPKKWQLTDVKLTNSLHPSRVLHVTSDDLQETGNIMMNW